MTIYRGSGGVNRTIKEQYRGYGGVNRTIKEQYRGYGGVNRKVFSAGFYTDFSAKGSDWTENGGAFTYGAGLYESEGGVKGSIENGSWVTKYLKIPVSLSGSAFTFETSVYVNSPSTADMIHLDIHLCNGDSSPVAAYTRRDAYAANLNQVWSAYKDVSGTMTSFYDSTLSSSYNGVTHVIKLVFNSGTLSLYKDGTLVTSTTTTYSTVTIDNIKIYIDGYNNSSYPICAYKLSYMSLKKEVA